MKYESQSYQSSKICVKMNKQPMISLQHISKQINVLYKYKIIYIQY